MSVSLTHLRSRIPGQLRGRRPCLHFSQLRLSDFLRCKPMPIGRSADRNLALCRSRYKKSASQFTDGCPSSDCIPGERSLQKLSRATFLPACSVPFSRFTNASCLNKIRNCTQVIYVYSSIQCAQWSHRIGLSAYKTFAIWMLDRLAYEISGFQHQQIGDEIAADELFTASILEV